MKYHLLFFLLSLATARLTQYDVHDPVSRDHSTQRHHCLTQPYDVSQVYWNYGGSTVLTNNKVRLTPSTQDRRGWLWNEYPLEKENWEVEFELEIFSKPHYGGDGFAFWILDSSMDPAFMVAPDALNGPLMGLRNKFTGFGVILDVYDNDNKRNNPSMFVLYNKNGETTHFDHDNDFENDMYAQTSDVNHGHTFKTEPTGSWHSHKCVADIRNSGKPAKILVKYLHKHLHVYLDTQMGHGYKYCLSVYMNTTFPDHHIAFTAATGQVADHHDLISVETRYLAESDQEFDDASLDHFGLTKTSTMGGFLHFTLFLNSIALTSIAVSCLYTYRNAMASRLDEVSLCFQLDQWIPTHWALQAVQVILLLILSNSQFFLFMINLPILLWHIIMKWRGFDRYTPTAGSSRHFKPSNWDIFNLNAGTRLYLTAFLYCSMEIVYIMNFFS